MASETIRDEISRRRMQMMKLHRAQTAPAKPPTVLSPFAATIMGMEGLDRVQSHPTSPEQAAAPVTMVAVPQAQPPRPSRRAQSHYNSFQTTCTPATDSPPSYSVAMRQKMPARRHTDYGNEMLPNYSCTVSAEARILFKVETLSPLENASSNTEATWNEGYLVVRGTMLSLFKSKDGKQGKPIISYTLQHAEVGLATDTSHTILVPQSRAAGLIPSSFRQKIWKKDPQLFRADKQTVLRLRVEAHQLAFADSSEELILELMNAISAGIDLAPSLDERSIPRQCTVPRRRRRPRADINDPAVIAEQERILGQMYPAFARPTAEAEVAATSPETTTQPRPNPTTQEVPATPSREEDEIDLSAMREEASESASSSSTGAQLTPVTTNAASVRPAVSRTTTASTVNSTWNDEMMYQTAPTNFGPDGKWRPPHTRTEAQVQRYIRRCLPILHAEAVRASDVLIEGGQRVKVNWKSQMVEPWELQPPTYRSHGFDELKGSAAATGSASTATALERTPSNASGSSTQDVVLTPGSSRSNLGSGEDEIAPMVLHFASYELTKAVTADGDKGKKSVRTTAVQQEQMKIQEVRRDEAATAVHGVHIGF